jgi:hypothetical protein
VRGKLQALFGKRPMEKDPAKGTSPAVDFTRREVRGTDRGQSRHRARAYSANPDYQTRRSEAEPGWKPEQYQLPT